MRLPERNRRVTVVLGVLRGTVPAILDCPGELAA